MILMKKKDNSSVSVHSISETSGRELLTAMYFLSSQLISVRGNVPS